MSNHDPNHSSHQRTILWIIVPVAVALTLLFTNLNGNVPTLREELDGKIEVKKVAPKKVAAPTVEEAMEPEAAAHH